MLVVVAGLCKIVLPDSFTMPLAGQIVSIPFCKLLCLALCKRPDRLNIFSANGLELPSIYHFVRGLFLEDAHVCSSLVTILALPCKDMPFRWALSSGYSIVFISSNPICTDSTPLEICKIPSVSIAPHPPPPAPPACLPPSYFFLASLLQAT